MKKEVSGYLYLLNTLILFSTYEVVSKTLVGKIDPFQINFIRFLIGGIILLVFVLFKEKPWISKKEFLWVMVIGILNVVLSMNLMQLSLYVKDAKASVAAVIFSSNPIFVTIFAAIIEKEKVRLYKIAGLLVGIAGIVVVFFDKLSFDLSSLLSPVLALMAAVLFGVFTVLGRKVAVSMGSLKMNAYSFLLGSVVLLPILIFKGVNPVVFDYSGIWQVVYLSLFVTGIAYLTYFKGLSIVGASSGSVIFFMKPIIASIIAIIFLKEKVTVSLIAGTVLIIMSISIVLYWIPVKERSNEILLKIVS